MFDILTQDGLFNLKKPKSSMINLEQMARALVRANRFNGHTRRPYSTASHSIMVASLCPPAKQLQALLHDAAEAYVGDISTPLKNLLGKTVIETAEDNILNAVYAHIGLPREPIHKEVLLADRHAVYVEGMCLFCEKSKPYAVFSKYKVEGLLVNFDFVERHMYLPEREIMDEYLQRLEEEINKHKGGMYGGSIASERNISNAEKSVRRRRRKSRHSGTSTYC